MPTTVAGAAMSGRRRAEVPRHRCQSDASYTMPAAVPSEVDASSWYVDAGISQQAVLMSATTHCRGSSALCAAGTVRQSIQRLTEFEMKSKFARLVLRYWACSGACVYPAPRLPAQIHLTRISRTLTKAIARVAVGPAADARRRTRRLVLAPVDTEKMVLPAHSFTSVCRRR